MAARRQGHFFPVETMQEQQQLRITHHPAVRPSDEDGAGSVHLPALANQGCQQLILSFHISKWINGQIEGPSSSFAIEEILRNYSAQLTADFKKQAKKHQEIPRIRLWGADGVSEEEFECVRSFVSVAF